MATGAGIAMEGPDPARKDRGDSPPRADAQSASPPFPPKEGRYIVVKALEDGVTIMGLTRGRDTRSHHSEKLDRGEVMVAQFTDLTAAMKVRGRAEILTDVGRVESGT